MEEQSKKFDIHQYLRMIARRKWFFIVPMVAISVSFLISSFFFPKIYEARAVILIEEDKVVNPLLANLAVSTEVKERLNALREEILAWPRLFQLVEALGLNKDIKTPLEIEKLISNIRRNIGLQMKSNEVVVISYQGPEPESTQNLVNTLCDILIKRNVSSQLEDTESAIDFINEQLVIYKEKLDKSEETLRKFKEVYGLQMAAQPAAASQDSAAQTEELNTVRAPLHQVNDELSKLEAELVIASVDCTEEHPRVKGLKRRIEALKEKRNLYIKDVAQRAGVEPQSYVNIADSVPRQQEELARLSRDKAINERIYAMLLERLESAKITGRLDSSDNRTRFRIIEPARLPLQPIKPDKLTFSFLGLLLGGACGFGFVYARDYTDSSFRDEEHLKQYFDLPVLGSISKIVTAEDVARRRNFAVKILPLIAILTLLLVLAAVSISRLFFPY